MTGLRHPKRTVAITLAAISAIYAPAALGQSGSTTGISANLHEPFHSSCFIPGTFLCGSGEVAGYGPVTEMIAFGGACDGACDLRTITFRDGGTLVLDETASACNGSGQSYKSPPQPFKCDLTDTVDGTHSTGTFAGATGTLSGSVSAGGGMATINLTGPITLA